MIRCIDLFAGIGGIRLGVEQAAADHDIDTRCVFTSEIDKFARQTYEANFSDDPEPVQGDITKIETDDIPDHDMLLAGFPCQPFSLSGVSKKNSLGREHGFDDKKSGNLFFEIERILGAKQPAAFLLENVKHLRGHDNGNTFRVIKEILEDELDYRIFYQVIDGQHYTPQHRERIFIVGLRADLFPDDEFTFPEMPEREKTFLNVLLPDEDVDEKYTLSDNLWTYLQEYKERHRKKGNGFGFGKVKKAADTVTRTLSARYYKDGSEILIHQEGKNPRRLTPRECARLMGYPELFEIPVSDTQAYRQFGNSVVVPVVRDIAYNLLPLIVELQQQAEEEAPAETA